MKKNIKVTNNDILLHEVLKDQRNAPKIFI